MEETEEGEIEGSPLAPSELAAFCDEVARFSDALTNVPRDAEPTELEEQLLDLSLRAAALADLPPPGTGSALADLRNTLEAVSKEAAEHGYDLQPPPPAPTSLRHWSRCGPHSRSAPRHRSMLRHLICDRRHVQLTGPCLPHRVPRCKWSSGGRDEGARHGSEWSVGRRRGAVTSLSVVAFLVTSSRVRSR